MNILGLRKIFLHPGEFVFAEPGTRVHTILGSCVAICLWHPLLKIGGMCHFVLPTSLQPATSPMDLDGRYGDQAMELFDFAMKIHHTEAEQYQAKIFGGCNMFVNNNTAEEKLIGQRNVAQARQLLATRGINITAAQVGENHHQRIVMDISNGNVWVRDHDLAEAEAKLPAIDITGTNPR